MAEIEVTPEAVSDIDEIYRFGLTTFGLAAAERYHAMIEAVIDRLARHPAYAPAYPGLRGIRYASAGSHHVFYRHENATVRVLRVLHPAMPPRARVNDSAPNRESVGEGKRGS